MLPLHHVESLLEGRPQNQRDTVLEIRNIVAEVAPGATETFRRYYFNYFYAERGGPVSAGVCQVGLYDNFVRLAFLHGAFIPDPHGLLTTGMRNRLAKRWVDLYAYDQIPWEAVRALIDAQAKFDPRGIKS
jgi:hypothetical protein